MVTIAGHTFDEKLLSDGVIIDIGCRGFEFADYFTENFVFCIDPDPKVFEGRQFHFMKRNLNLAISNKSGESAFYENGEATVLKELDPDQNHPFIPCETITMGLLHRFTGDNIDILKLDCEGAEYMILDESFKPIPKQISVEFHHHTVPELHNEKIQGILNRLAIHYNAVNLVWDSQHGAGFNYWDVLFIRKDL